MSSPRVHLLKGGSASHTNSPRMAATAGAALPPASSLAASSSTALLRGTLLVQSSPTALAQSAAAAIPVAPASHSSRRRHVEYRGGGGDSGEFGTASSPSHGHSSTSYRRGGTSQMQSREELRAAFGVFDSSGVGVISCSDFRVVYQMLVAGATESEIGDVIFTLDQKGEGQIAFEEFATLMQRRAAMAAHENGGGGGNGGGNGGGGGGLGSTLLDEALSVFDSGDPAYLRMDVSEVLHICELLKEHLSEEEKESLLREMHPDPQDQTINYARLVQQMLPGGS